MSPTIRIDDDVFNELKGHAEPFVDTPNSVLRRLLGLAPKADSAEEPASDESTVGDGRSKNGRSTQSRSARRRKKAPRAATGTMLPDVDYEVPILEILRDSGGRAPTREVIDALGERLGGRLTETDHERLSSGDVRWRNRSQFVRLKLVEKGEMSKGSPRGVWEISRPASSAWGADVERREEQRRRGRSSSKVADTAHRALANHEVVTIAVFLLGGDQASQRHRGRRKEGERDRPWSLHLAQVQGPDQPRDHPRLSVGREEEVKGRVRHWLRKRRLVTLRSRARVCAARISTISRRLEARTAA